MLNYPQTIYQWDTGINLDAPTMDSGWAHFEHSAGAMNLTLDQGLSSEITVDRNIFLKKVGYVPGTYTFVYSNMGGGVNRWVLSEKNDEVITLADYGLTRIGVAAAGDAYGFTLHEVWPVAISDHKAHIPDELLQINGTIRAYAYTATSASETKTITIDTFSVIPRPQPTDYAFEATIVPTYAGLTQFITDLTALKNTLSTWQVQVNDGVGTPSAQVSMSADRTVLTFNNIKGATGRGIESVTLTNDYRLQFNYTDGNVSVTNKVRGPQGQQGPQGIQGAQGEKGDKGDTGDSYTITSADYSAIADVVVVEHRGELKGDKGDTGETGPQGEQGETGPQGERGIQGETGPQGSVGPAGPVGPIGATGAQGPAGADGADGDDYVITTEDYENIADIVEERYVTDLNATKRKLDILYKLSEGITYDYESDSASAYTKSVPSGAVVGEVLQIGGKSQVVDGEILHAMTDKVVVKGKNLIRSMSRNGNTIYFNGATSNVDYIFEAGTYTISYERAYGASVYFKTASSESVRITTDAQHTFTVEEPFSLRIYRNGMADGDVWNVQLEEGSTATAYSPYHEPLELTIPTSITSLTGYGWGISDSVRNYVDFENAQYVQMLSEVHIGSDGQIAGTQLATPIVTDITDLLTDFDCEGGGTITFHQSNTELPIPNKIEYLVSLREA